MTLYPNQVLENYMNHNALLNTAFKEVRQCCQHLLQGFDRLATPQANKSDKERFTSSIDADIQHKLITALKDKYPKHLFVAEEPSSESTQSLPDHSDVWVIDPIDGSNNYMHNIPTFTISMCYYYFGEKKAALVYDPINDELFTAIEGKGALLNQHRIQGSRLDRIDLALCGIEGKNDFHPNVENHVRTTRKLGCTSLTLCYLASGRFDLGVCQAPHLWDIAAGMLIAQEAGIQFINQDNKPYQEDDAVLIGAAPLLAKQLIK